MSGGGASGELVQPNYLIQTHANWLNAYKPPLDSTDGIKYDDMWTAISANTLNVADEMTTASTLNPVTGVAAYDPDPWLTAVDDRLAEWDDLVADLDPYDKMLLAVESALAMVDDEILSESVLDDAVAAHTARTQPEFQRLLAGELASLLTGRAVMTGGLDDAFAGMTIQRTADLADYSAKLGMTFHGQRAEMAQNFTNTFVQILQLQMTVHEAVTVHMQDLAKMRIVAMQDQIETDLKYDEAEVKWKLNLFEFGSSVIASYSGAGPMPKPSTAGDRAIANLGNAFTTGIGVGTATKNPTIGGLAGLGYLGFTALASAWK